MRKFAKFLLYTTLFITCVALDYISKVIMVMELAHGPVRITSWFNLALARNYGVSWNLLSSYTSMQQWLLSSFILLLLFTFLGYTISLFRCNENVFFEVLVLAGGFANVRDRIMYGYVIDFLEFHVGDWYWPTFNVADVLIVCGVIGIMIKTLRRG